MAEDMDSNNGLVGSSFSLVRYNNPVLIDKKGDDGALLPPGAGAGAPTPAKRSAPGEASEASSSVASGKPQTETEEILDSILPPRWE